MKRTEPETNKACSVARCVNPVQAKGLCSTHYQRMRKGVPLDAPMRKSRGRNATTCIVRGCGNVQWARGLCPMHYWRWRTRGDAGIPDSEKTGRITMRNGYVLVFVGRDHPSATPGSKGYALEHRLVVERVIGRQLERHESVHHKNGIRDDNRPTNLELWASLPQPGGQRVADLVAFVVKHYPKEVRAALRAAK